MKILSLVKILVFCFIIFIVSSKIAQFFSDNASNVSTEAIETQTYTAPVTSNDVEQRILREIQSFSDSDITSITNKKNLYQKLVLLQPDNSQYASMLKVYTHRLVTKQGEMLAEYGPDYAERLNLPTTQIETSVGNHSSSNEEPTVRTSKGYLNNAWAISISDGECYNECSYYANDSKSYRGDDIVGACQFGCSKRPFGGVRNDKALDYCQKRAGYHGWELQACIYGMTQPQ